MPQSMPQFVAPVPSVLKGIALKATAMTLFAIMAGFVKYLGTVVPVNQIGFFRSIFGFIPLFIMIFSQADGVAVLRTRRPFGHVSRAVAGTGAMFASFAALKLLPLADAMALGFSAPLFVTVLAVPILHEKVGPYRIGAVLFGFLGVLVVAQPDALLSGQAMSAMGVGFALLAAFLVGFAQTFLRALGLTENPLTTVFYYSLTMAFVSGLTLPFSWVTPGYTDLALLIGMGLLGGVAQIILTTSYRYAGASTLAPFDYLQLLWALIIGMIVFGETPKVSVLFGAGIIIASGIFIVLRERRLARAEMPATTPPA